jgi:hypothetical protein
MTHGRVILCTFHLSLCLTESLIHISQFLHNFGKSVKVRQDLPIYQISVSTHPHINTARDQKPRINDDLLKLRSMKRMDSHLLDRMPQASQRLNRTPVKIFSTLSIP